MVGRVKDIIYTKRETSRGTHLLSKGQFLQLSYFWPDFHETLNVASLVRVKVIRYSKNEFNCGTNIISLYYVYFKCQSERFVP